MLSNFPYVGPFVLGHIMAFPKLITSKVRASYHKKKKAEPPGSAFFLGAGSSPASLAEKPLQSNTRDCSRYYLGLSGERPLNFLIFYQKVLNMSRIF